MNGDSGPGSRTGRVVLGLLAAVVVAGCSSTSGDRASGSRRANPTGEEAAAPGRADPARRGGGFYQDDGPGDRDLADLAALAAQPEPVPVQEPLHPRANQPYRVLGSDYRPMTQRAPFRQRGVASWYGRKFHGQPTSIGEPYDMYGMTAAHPTLPIPSYVRVTHLGNGRSVVVRVNDRGPFLHGRAIDLSYLAAYKLGYAALGSAEVEVELLDPSRELELHAAALPALAPAAASAAMLGAGTPMEASPAPAAPLEPAPARAMPLELVPVGAVTAAVKLATVTSAPISSASVAPVASNPAALPAAISPAAFHPASVYPAAGVPASSALASSAAARPATATTSAGATAASTSAAATSAATSATALSATASSQAADTAAPAPLHFLQLGAFSARTNAEVASMQLRRQLNWLQVPIEVASHGSLFRVQAGPYRVRELAARAGSEVAARTGLRPLLLSRLPD